VRNGQSLNELDRACTRLSTNEYPFTATIIAVSCDADPAEGIKRAHNRWPNIHHHCHIDGQTIKSLNIRYVPNRVIVDVRTGKIRMWWDGEFGRVLHGPWASSVKNPSVGVLGECWKYAKDKKA